MNALKGAKKFVNLLVYLHGYVKGSLVILWLTPFELVSYLWNYDALMNHDVGKFNEIIVLHVRLWAFESSLFNNFIIGFNQFLSCLEEMIPSCGSNMGMGTVTPA